MKKILLTATMLLAGMSAAFAQVPDASSWKAGDEITNKIGWRNLDFTSTNGNVIKETASDAPETGEPDMYDVDGWTFVKQEKKGNTTREGGLFELYDGAEADLYQYVQLPAGMYRVTCKGYYRNGTSWADDPNSFGTSDWEDNALLYVQNGTYDVESQEFTAGRTFKNPLMPRLFEGVDHQLYVGPKDGEEGYPGWDMSDGHYTRGTGADQIDLGWGPCSVPGSLVWFQSDENLYDPYDDGEGVVYNQVDFFLTKDGYVRVGVSKQEPKGADSFMVTNFKMYYLGAGDESMELAAAQDEVAEYLHMLEDLGQKVETQYDGGLLAAMISDAVMEFEPFDGYTDIEDLTMEEIPAALEYAKNLYESAAAAVAVYGQLKDAADKAAILYNQTNYPGKAAYGEALNKAQQCFDPDYAGGDDDSFGMFQEIYDELIAARLAYLMSQEKVNGAYNFSSAITTPFFCQEMYSPVWNEEANAYVFPNVEGVEDELQPENTWATVQEHDYLDFYNPTKIEDGEEKENEYYHPDWLRISDGIKINEKYVENQWVIKATTFHGSGVSAVTMQHSYPAIGGWTPEPSGNPELLTQTITGLPNGYYSMSALMCNAGADISPLQFVYIEAAGVQEKANLTMKGNPWWGGNREAWRAGVWEKLATNMVYVSDGKVTIGSSSDAFYAVTGFQLYYYGETPDFTSLVAPALEKARANANELAWPGDVAAANAILDGVPATIDSDEAYQTAQAAINAANDYCATANKVVGAWDGMGNFQKLMDAYDEGTPENDFLTTAWMETMNLGDPEGNDTYKDAIANDETYAAYEDYLAYRKSMGDLINASAVAPIISKQNAALTEKMATAADIAKMKEELAGPYNEALLESLGFDKATENNPVDVTALLVNPKFDEGKKGWMGDPTVTSTEVAAEVTALSLGAAEKWDTTFDVYQVINGLPAGCYMLQAQACYRDAGNATDAYKNWVYMSGEEMELWENPNAVIYANGDANPIVSIASVFPTTRSMTNYVDKMVEAEEGDEYGNPVYVEHYRAMEAMEDVEDYRQSVDATSWWWDTEIDDEDGPFYYPASLMGISKYFKDHPTDYINTVATMVEEGGSLRVGIKKSVTVSGDWVPMDNFKLFYLGKTAPTGINDVAKTDAAPAGIYTISGAKAAKMQKGINIVKMSNGDVKKVFVK